MRSVDGTIVASGCAMDD